jgi:hypothetical protein
LSEAKDDGPLLVVRDAEYPKVGAEGRLEATEKLPIGCDNQPTPVQRLCPACPAMIERFRD